MPTSKRAVAKYAGGFIAWVIGSGFATGQEVLRFFTSYGTLSYGVVLVNLIGFLFIGQLILTTGYEKKAVVNFNPYVHFCGRKLGTFYSWLIPVTIVLIMPVLISGAGATLHQYYGISPVIGSAIMTLMVLVAYLIGFEHLVRIVSAIGPIIIIFSLIVGLTTVFRDFSRFGEISSYEAVLSQSHASPHWLLSAILYLSLTFLSGSTYYTALGQSAANRKEAKYGAIVGALALIAAITIMNTAILLNGENTVLLSIPMLFLAREISYPLGAVFSVVLILGMFSSCSAMMWTVCSRFNKGGIRGNRFFAVLIALFTFTMGLLSFRDLVGTLYPLVGYLGLIYISCLVYKGLRGKSGGQSPIKSR